MGFQAGAGQGKWRTARHTVIDMRDMTDEHLKNAIKVCKGDGPKPKNPAKLHELERELARRNGSAAGFSVYQRAPTYRLVEEIMEID